MVLAAGLDPVTAIGQWGSTGAVLLVLFAVGRFVYKRESDRADRLENELREVNKSIIDKYVPTLDSTAKALLDANQLIVELRTELRIRSGHA